MLSQAITEIALAIGVGCMIYLTYRLQNWHYDDEDFDFEEDKPMIMRVEAPQKCWNFDLLKDADKKTLDRIKEEREQKGIEVPFAEFFDKKVKEGGER